MSDSFLEICEHVVNNPEALPDGFRVYRIDGHVVWATKEFSEHIQRLADLTQDFVWSCPFMTNPLENQEYTQKFCFDTGLCKPCYSEDCWGCDEDPDEEEGQYCAASEEDWRQIEQKYG